MKMADWECFWRSARIMTDRDVIVEVAACGDYFREVGKPSIA
jgi:hypothetical protein